MKKTMVLAVAAATMLVLSAKALAAEPAKAKTEVVGQEVVEKEGEFCGICESKKRVTELVPWLKVGADLRLRAIWDRNIFFDEQVTSSERFWQRYRARLWAQITPIENVDINIRLVTEPRYYCQPRSMDDHWIRDEILFDKGNVEWKKILGMPLKIKVGRQDMRLGEGWLVFEGTPLDGSRTIYFDAIRGTYEMADIKTTIDLIYIDNYANSSQWIRPFCDKDVDLVEQDERGAIAYVSNKSLIPGGQIDGYFILKHDHEKRTVSAGSEGTIYTIGAMIKGKLDDNWKYYAEAAPQFGHRNGHDLCAFGMNSKVTYDFNDAMKNSLRVGYEFLSGDRNHVKNFNRLWGRYPQWSNIFNGYADTVDGQRPAQSSNLHRIGVGHTFVPIKDLQVITDYHALWSNVRANSANVTSDGNFRGHLGTLQVKHKVNEHLSHTFTGEVMCPGDYYVDAKKETAAFLRYEIMLSW